MSANPLPPSIIIPSYDAQVSDAIRQCRTDVARVGWHCTAVGASTVPFLYTVGFQHTLGVPELVIGGLPLDTAHSLLAEAFEVFTERPLTHVGEQRHDILVGYPVRFEEVREELLGTLFCISDGYYGQVVPRYQLLWPDSVGRFPGEMGTSLLVNRAQDLAFLDIAQDIFAL